LSKLKNHPLYAIEAHLLKFQTIYPRGREHVVSTINVRGKEIDVYPRSHVHTLHTRDRWVREMRQVRDGEAPLKRVKKLVSRWKATRVNDTGAEAAVEDDKADDELNDLFGFWQTDPFNPGEAHEGKVPKNERGHVDLWTPDHLPRGCVHVRLPRVVAAARKAKIDYAPAMTGFSVHCGWSVPVIDGIVICAEDEPKLLEEFYRVSAERSLQGAVQTTELTLVPLSQSERQREVRAEQRRLERVFAGWRRVVRPLLVKARVAAMMDEAGDFGQGPAPISLQ
jgi:xeroderma pigmentosum group C-complementing protein